MTVSCTGLPLLSKRAGMAELPWRSERTWQYSNPRCSFTPTVTVIFVMGRTWALSPTVQPEGSVLFICLPKAVGSYDFIPR